MSSITTNFFKNFFAAEKEGGGSLIVLKIKYARPQARARDKKDESFSYELLCNVMSDERGKPRVMSCAARNVVAYPPTAIPKLIAAKKEQQDSPAIPLFTTTI